MKKVQSSALNNVEAIVAHLQSVANKDHLAGAKYFGINNDTALGVPLPALRTLAKSIGKDHLLALQLWETNVHEARILASMIDVAAEVTTEQIDAWTADFQSWDVCDQVCGNLFDKTPFAVDKAIEFSAAKEEYVKRASFVLMASYAVHNKKAPDDVFIEFLDVIAREANDNRNFVKKAINWALRQIGKRNRRLHLKAIQTANAIKEAESPAARWIAADALRELQSEKIIAKMQVK
jgi:3-methyladenine DNA glycosylase AlkD